MTPLAPSAPDNQAPAKPGILVADDDAAIRTLLLGAHTEIDLARP